jgi:hypothetical protein
VSNRESVISERELAGVIAHGLMNSLAAVCGAAGTLRRYDGRLTDGDRDELLTTIVEHAEVFNDGLAAILRHCSDAFGDAATTMALAARTVRALPCEDLPPVLDGLIAHCSVLELGLAAMVRGLSRDVVSYLDSLRRPFAGAG